MRNISKVYLDPAKSLADATVGELLARVREEFGAKSLAHLMVIVPTAQSGRQLRERLSLAVGEKGVLSPRIVEPLQLLVPADLRYTVARDVELSAAFLSFVRSLPAGKWSGIFCDSAEARDGDSLLGFLDQLEDIWRTLAGRGLLMADVIADERAKEVLESASGNECERWRELGEFEKSFYDFLHEKGLCTQYEAIHLAKSAPEIVPSEIEEIILPSLVDPIRVLDDVLLASLAARSDLKVSIMIHASESEAEKFDEWGRPATSYWCRKDVRDFTSFTDESVICTGVNRDMCELVAKAFPLPTDGDESPELPSLGLVDTQAYPELEAAFLSRGWNLHNPERHFLSHSSLGKIVECLLSFRVEPISRKLFEAFLKCEDVISAVERCMRLENRASKDSNGTKRADILKQLNDYGNAHLNVVVPEVGEITDAKYGCFAKAVEIVRGWFGEARESGTAVGFVRSVLGKIYEDRRFKGTLEEKEFRAAIESL